MGDPPPWAANVENCRASFVDPHSSHLGLARLEETSFSKAWLQSRQMYS